MGKWRGGRKEGCRKKKMEKEKYPIQDSATTIFILVITFFLSDEEHRALLPGYIAHETTVNNKQVGNQN